MSPANNSASPPSDAVAALNRAVFMRESQQAARALERVLESDANFCLPVRHQHDLARLLELGNEPRLALGAYEAILVNHPEAPQFNQALRGAGHLAYRLKQYKKCRAYLERFLYDGQPAHPERMDAEGLLARLPDGKGLRDPSEYECAREGAEDHRHEGSGIYIDDSEEEKPGEPPESSSRMPTLIDSDPDTRAREGLSSEVLQRGVRPAPDTDEENDVEENVESFLFGQMDAAETINPADTIEVHPTSENPATWDAAGKTPPLSMASRDLRSSSYNKLIQSRDDGMEYALILPHGTRMSVSSVVHAMQIVDDSLDEQSAKNRMIECKGLLKGGMNRAAAIELSDRLAAIDHKLVFRAIERNTLPAEPTIVRRAELLEPGLRLHTDLGVRKVKWNMIRLVNCGRTGSDPVLDLFCEVSLVHYRLGVPDLSFAEIINEPGSDESDGVRRVLATIDEHGDDSTLWSRPAISLLEGELARPQKFGDIDELDRYNRCLLLTHFGLEVNLET